MKRINVNWIRQNKYIGMIQIEAKIYEPKAI